MNWNWILEYSYVGAQVQQDGMKYYTGRDIR